MFTRWFSVKDDKSSLIIGPRRSGKTTLLKALFPDYKYVTLDNLDYLDWAGKDPKGFIESLGSKAIIDEIQHDPKLTVAVKYAIDNQNARFLMTGSSSVGLLDKAADTLAGRINLRALPTACFGENAGAPTHKILDEQPDRLQLKEGQRRLESALEYGQFPEVLTCQTDEERNDLLLNYRDTYFTRDLMQMVNLENLDGLLTIFYHLARSLSSHLEVANFARESGMSYPTTKKYLNNLYMSHLTFRLYGYQYGPAKKFIKAAKTYFADNGIVKSLNVKLNEGQILENFVIAEFEKRRKLGFLKCDRLYYYKSVAGREIDLLFEVDDQLNAIEIKHTRNPSLRDVSNLVQFSKHVSKPVNMYLLYTGEEYGQLNGVKIVPVAALFRGI